MKLQIRFMSCPSEFRRVAIVRIIGCALAFVVVSCSAGNAGPPAAPVNSPLVDAENYFEHGDFLHAIAIVKALPGYDQNFQYRYNVAVAAFDMGDMITAQGELDAAKVLPNADGTSAAKLQAAIALENSRPNPNPPGDASCQNYHGHNTGYLAYCLKVIQQNQCYKITAPAPCAQLNWLNFV